MPLPPLPNPSSPVTRLAGLARAVPATVFLFSTLLLFNGVQVASLVVLPWSRRVFRAVNRWAADTWWGWCVSVGRGVYGVRLEVSGDDVPMRENAIVIANHQQMSDITFLMHFARSRDRLGDMKWFVKRAVRLVPGVGWGMAFLDCIFVHRDWAADRASVEATFRRIVQDRVPVWLISFVEGTRITPAKAAAARAFATARGLPPLRHLLMPRTKGFVATVTGLRDHVDAVYDLTIGYVGGVPSLWQYIQGYARVAHLHVRRHTLTSLPEAPAELAEWLNLRFAEKDDLLERFYALGSFVAAEPRLAPAAVEPAPGPAA